MNYSGSSVIQASGILSNSDYIYKMFKNNKKLFSIALPYGFDKIIQFFRFRTLAIRPCQILILFYILTYDFLQKNEFYLKLKRVLLLLIASRTDSK